MKTKYYIVLIMLLLLLSNCAQPQTNSPISTPTQLQLEATWTPSPTLFMAPTNTSRPTFTPIPSNTPFSVATFAATNPPTIESSTLGGLSSPPYLVYVKKISGKEQIALVNQDGSGIKTIPLPDNGFYAGNVSPTGEWLVFYTGSEGEQTLTDGPIYDLAINLMHLPDGTIHKVTDLLTKDFPNNIEKIAELAKNSNDPDIAFMDTATIVSLMQGTFLYKLTISQWSPSGEALAFAGELDGPSSDLYLYNLNNGGIRRLSSGLKNIDFIDWFPNGDQILYGSSYLPCEGDCSTYYVTNLNGSKSREIKNFETFGGGTYMENWSGSSMLIVYTQANVIGTCCLRNFDFKNDKLNMLYGGSFQNYAYDPQTNLLAISMTDSVENLLAIPTTANPVNNGPGTYLIDNNGMRKVEEPGTVYYLGWKDYPFILSANGIKLLSASGASKMLTEGEFVPFASRNNKYVALCDLTFSQTTNGLKVFDNNQNLVLEIKGQRVTNVIWRIDSQGLFYVTNNELYYVGIKDKTPMLIDAHLNDQIFDTNYQSFNWVR